MPSVIRDIALKAAQEEYATTRRLGGSAQEATLAGCRVMLDIRAIAADGGEVVQMMIDAPDGWWMGS